MARKKRELSKEEIEIQEIKENYDWVFSTIKAVIITLVVFIFLVRIVEVNGTSMYPTLEDSDKVLISDLFYSPKAGDIVVFKKDEYDSNRALIKRIIATEGQEINIDFDNGIVYIDGVAIDEPYINELTHTKLNFIGPKTVPQGCVFVMGDNRNASTDSRYSSIGMVDERLILGKVLCVIYPITHFGKAG